VVFPASAPFDLFYFLIEINIVLAIFNLIPVSPLDGEKILVGILPDQEGRRVDAFLGRFGIILLFILIFPIFGGNSLISPVMNPIINFFLRILIPGFSTI
jgi:Zn-dependent protease